jgi:Fic family protein
VKLQLKSPSIFQEKHVPHDTSLIGMSALVHCLDVEAPVRKPACVSAQRIKEIKRDAGEWHVFDNKYAVKNTVDAHLVFALRHEDLDLLVLKRIFMSIPEQALAEYVRSAPTGPLVRRIWFLYEYLTEKFLDVPDAGKVSSVDLLDTSHYFTVAGTVSTRHRVRNNLLGTRRFCPVIRRTQSLTAFIEKQLSARAQATLSKVSPLLVARAASFLLLADTQASFAIEGERLAVNTRERWLKAVQQVGKYRLSKDELNRLHSILIGDYRFIKPGFREDLVFLGERTTDNEPLPEFIGARPQDLNELIDGLIEASLIMGESSLDGILQAAAVAFGFVYIHPFEDGNGRLHRCLIHQTLAEKKFTPPGLVFPVSSVMLNWIDQYRMVLQSHSTPLMNFIQWVPTIRGNVEVRNDTIDLYRYFDCTEAAEFLYRCVEETVEKDVPQEIEYLKRYDQAMQRIMDTVEMPNRMVNNFIMFTRQNNWTLPKKRRRDEFGKLTDDEVETLQAIVREAFDTFDTP